MLSAKRGGDNQRKRSTFLKTKERSPYLRLGLDNPLLAGLLGLALLSATTLLITPGVLTRPRTLDDADVGRIARRDYRATRDFTYTEPDEAATEKKREEVAKAVLPVYDFNLDESKRIQEQISQAFEYMRALFRQYDERLAAAEAQEKPHDGEERAQGHQQNGKHSPKAGQAAKEDDAKVAAKAELEAWLAEELELRRPEFFRKLQQTLTPEEYGFLARHRFSQEMERHLEDLVSSVMQFKILTSIGPLKYHRDRGIRLRYMHGTTPGREEDVKDDFRDFISLQEALERLVVLARKTMKDVDPKIRDTLVDIAGRLVVANCVYDRSETKARQERARGSVQALAVTKKFHKGQTIVRRGQRISRQQVAIVQEDLKEYQAKDMALAVAGNALLILLLSYTVLVFFGRFVRKFQGNRKDLAFLGIWLVFMLSVYKVSLFTTTAVAESWRAIPLQAYLYLVPLAAAPMLVRMVLNSETAVAAAVLESILVGVMVGWDLSYMAFSVVGGLVGAGGVGKAKERADLLKAGMRTGLVNGLFVFEVLLGSGELFSLDAVLHIFMGLLGGILSGLVVTAMLPVVESLFDYTTNIKLLELANLNNPLLKELAIKAPGTFHHSILVGNLVEAAAESIRANPLLARVGAYYHDVGKIRAPHYFAENQRPGQNPHDKLKPSMSALILKEHVRDGVKMLKARGYPKIIADICEQHVGTTLIAYFYHKAKKQAEERGEPPPLETDYRYPGPKPQTREAALVFLGDSVEAAAKSIPDPSPARLKGMVQNLINARFIDGQLSECDLTLGDLHKIAKAFIRNLTGMYHFRPEYPSDKKKQDDTGQRRTGQNRRPSRKPDQGQDKAGPAQDKGAQDDRVPDGPVPEGRDTKGGGERRHVPADTFSSMMIAKDASMLIPGHAGPQESQAQGDQTEAGATRPERPMRKHRDDQTKQGKGDEGGSKNRGGRGQDHRLPHDETPSLRRLGSIDVE